MLTGKPETFRLPSQKDAFLRAQFNAQHDAYQETYRGGDFLVILRNGRPIGRLYLARWEREIRIVDIALLPEYRNAGIGSDILKDILAEGAPGGKRAGIHVEMFNPALTLLNGWVSQTAGARGLTWEQVKKQDTAPAQSRPSPDFKLTPKERRLLKDPDWMTEDEAGLIVSLRRRAEGGYIPAEEVLAEQGLPLED